MKVKKMSLKYDDLNYAREVVVLTFTGSSFHILNAIWAKLWHPNLRYAIGVMNRFALSDFNERYATIVSDCKMTASSSNQGILTTSKQPFVFIS